MNVPDPAAGDQRKWQPLSSHQRRVAGVLVEKAKTTPDAYPMTLNALTNGCNQKSNRAPQMHLRPKEVAEALEQLRALGAVGEVQAGGRVPKYRHYLYDWLGVDKVELAVMAELLLRGEQTAGELRARAARMEPIADLAALRPVLHLLMEKRLVIPLTPEGRGQVVTHGLYEPPEMEALQARYGWRPAVSAGAETPPSAPAPSAPLSDAAREMFRQLQSQLADLRSEVDQLRRRFDELQQLLS